MKYFVVSDIHSFYTELNTSLKKCGFDKRNPDHTLIVCGDVFDRGGETIEVYKFLKSIPKKRCILIKGNHEQLYFELLNKVYPQDYDFSNGTVRTFCQIAGYELNDEDISKSAPHDLALPERHFHFIAHHYESSTSLGDLWKKIQTAVKKSEITKWLQSTQWINYYELDKYIFVHSFIPLIWQEERGLTEQYCIYYGWTKFFTEHPNWRKASNKEWSNATWGCAYTFFDAGLFNQELEKNKVLVCGHYKCSAFNKHYLNRDVHDLYYGKNLIAIDATTALSRQVNVFIIDEDGKCYDQNGLLEYKKPIPIIETVTLDKEEYEKYAKDVTNS